MRSCTGASTRVSCGQDFLAHPDQTSSCQTPTRQAAAKRRQRLSSTHDRRHSGASSPAVTSDIMCPACGPCSHVRTYGWMSTQRVVILGLTDKPRTQKQVKCKMDVSLPPELNLQYAHSVRTAGPVSFIHRILLLLCTNTGSS